MTTLSMTAGATARDRVEQIGVVAVLGLAAATQLSIAAAQILLAIGALAWLAGHLARRSRLDAPAFFWALVGYAMLTLLSAGFSRDPIASLVDCKQLTLLLIVPVVYDFARGTRARPVLWVVLTVGALSALVGIVQYGVLNYDILRRRPQGALSHWMTYSGTLMLVLCAAVARLLYDSRDRGWAAVVLPALVASIAITGTRSAWVGGMAGVAVLLLLRDLRLVAILPLATALIVAVAPAPLTERIYSMFDMNDPTIRDRVAMLESGVAIVRDHPLFGVGPDMVGEVYGDYRMATAVEPHNVHLHNVPMQIAAERGIPALMMWTGFVVAALVGLRRLLARPRHRTLAAAALAATVAMVAAGLFEYNFGDSEFLMLYLVLLTLPFAAERDGGLPE